MDFIKANRIEFRWSELGDYYMYDTRAKIFTLLEFIKIPKTSAPSVSKVSRSHVRSPETPSVSSPNDPEWEVYKLAAIQSLPEGPNKKIPEKYQKLINKFPSLLNPNFSEVKHTIEHAIDTADSPPIRSKVRPLLPGSPKAIAGHEAWMEMVRLGIVERVDPHEGHYYSSPSTFRLSLTALRGRVGTSGL